MFSTVHKHPKAQHCNQLTWLQRVYLILESQTLFKKTCEQSALHKWHACYICASIFLCKTFAPKHVKQVHYINHMSAKCVPNYLGSIVLQENMSEQCTIIYLYTLAMFVIWPPKAKPSQPTECKVISGEVYLNWMCWQPPPDIFPRPYSRVP